MIKKRIRNFRKKEDGAVMVIAALGLVVFLSVVSLVTDMGLKYHQKSKLQSAMDSAALAAVRYMPDKPTARTVALEYVEKNGFSADSVTIEFPSDEIIRVSDSKESKTIFASLFKINSVQINAKAAARYVDKDVAIDFDYLMFHGDNSQFTLNGHYNIGGSIFGNGNVYADGGGCTVSGTIFSAGEASYNQSSVSVNNLASKVTSQKLPDFDEMIMAGVPIVEESMFIKTYSHISKSNFYLNKYSAGTVINSSVSINGNTYCGGTLSTSYLSDVLVIYGDLYVEGDFTPQCPVYVKGNAYIGGNLTTTWDKSLTVGGDLYVVGTTTLNGHTVIHGNNFYTGGDLIRSSTYNLQCNCETYVGGNITLNGTSVFNGPVYCRGLFDKQGSVSMTVNGNIYAYDKLKLQSGGTTVNGSVFVWGKNASSDETATDIAGPFTMNGDLYNRKGNLSLSGQGTYTIKGVIYSGGNLSTNQGSSGITLDGCIIAEKDISIGGSTHTYNESGGTLSIYSRDGNIKLYSQQGGFDSWGIIYAPKGNVALASGDFDIHGSIIGNTITCNPGGLNMSYNDRQLPYSKKIKAAVLIE